jgi:coenzyme Q-binding protein COQ10
MPQFETVKRVGHPPVQMFALVADVERYPQFLPLCELLVVRSRKERDGQSVLIADMTVGYKAIRETFTSQVHLKPAENRIEVKYIDGPFKYLSNVWSFDPAEGGATDIHFSIDYEFRNKLLGMLMGTMFDRAFRLFTSAFEKRADEVYGVDAGSGAKQ